MARKIKLFETENLGKSSELYASVLRVAPEGMTLDLMKSRMAIMDKLEKANSSIILEEADWKVLDQVLKANKWPQVHPDIIKVCDAVSEAKTVEI